VANDTELSPPQDSPAGDVIRLDPNSGLEMLLTYVAFFALAIGCLLPVFGHPMWTSAVAAAVVVVAWIVRCNVDDYYVIDRKRGVVEYVSTVFFHTSTSPVCAIADIVSVSEWCPGRRGAPIGPVGPTTLYLHLNDERRISLGDARFPFVREASYLAGTSQERLAAPKTTTVAVLASILHVPERDPRPDEDAK